MATTRMVFNLVANDSASSAFDKLARNVELSNAAIEKHNAAAGRSSKALDDNSRAADNNNSSMTRLSGTLTSTSKGFSAIATAAVALAPAALPAVGLLGAGIAGVGGIVASTGAALGVFGFTAKAQFTALSTAAKGYSTIQAQVNKDAENVAIAKQAVANAQGTKQLTAAQSQLSSATRALTGDQQKLTDAQGAFNKQFGPAAKGYENLTAAWNKWKTATSGPTLAILGEGMNLLAVALPKLRPLFDTGAQAAGRFLDAIKGWVSGGGMDRAVTVLNKMAQAVLPPLEKAMRNIATAAGIVAPMFATFATGVANGVAHITGAFAQWLASNGASAFQKFMAYITANGPAVFALLKSLADAAVKIAQSLAPLAPISLAIAGALAKLIAAAPPGLIQAAAVAFVAYSTAAKGLGAIVPIIQDIKDFTKAMTGLDIAMNANVIGLIVLAIAALGIALYVAWQKSAGFRDFIKTIGAVVLTMGTTVVQGLKIVVDAVLGFFGGIIHGAATAFGWIPGLGPKLKGAATAFDGFKTGVDGAFNNMISTMNGWSNQLTSQKATVASVSASVVADFTRQGNSAKSAKTDLDNYTNAVRFNGATSSAAQQARSQLITDLVNSGVNAGKAKTDVSNYTTAVTNNGIYSDQARAARTRLINDILSAAGNARQGKTDTDNLTKAVQNHGLTSDIYRAARTRLINDLVASGSDSKTAAGLVDGLGRSVANLKDKKVNVSVSGTGAWSITQGSLQQKLTAGTAFAGAAGGIIPGYAPGRDSVIAHVSPGEAILVPEAVQAIGPANILALNRAYAGGRVSRGMKFAGGGLVGAGSWVTGKYGDTVAYGVNAITKALTDAINAAVSAAKAAAAAAASLGGGKPGAVTSGVMQWAGLVSQALAMLGLPQSFASAVLYQMQTESGGNAAAINLWDSNAARGTPSKGLMQVIDPTFAAYHVAGTSNNIYDPLANIAAAINYARHVYGPSLGALGSGHGYKSGSWDVPATGPAVVHQGEMILPAQLAEAVRGAIGSGSGPQSDRLERLLKQLIAVSASQGQQFAQALDGAARRSRTY